MHATGGEKMLDYGVTRPWAPTLHELMPLLTASI